MNNTAARNKKKITIGLDLGDRRHTYCVLEETGKVAREGTLANTSEQLANVARSYPGATGVMEAGTHSPWVSRFLQELGLRVIVANPRKTRAIPAADANMRAGRFQEGLPVGISLAGKTIGIIGLGRLGSSMASYCRALT